MSQRKTGPPGSTASFRGRQCACGLHHSQARSLCAVALTRLLPCQPWRLRPALPPRLSFRGCATVGWTTASERRVPSAGLSPDRRSGPRTLDGEALRPAGLAQRSLRGRSSGGEGRAPEGFRGWLARVLGWASGSGTRVSSLVPRPSPARSSGGDHRCFRGQRTSPRACKIMLCEQSALQNTMLRKMALHSFLEGHG